jgi:ElaB/YqjD/DUF883 family membrane-anchored ribosome-binding protein
MGSLDTTRGIDQMQDAAGAVANRVSSLADQVGQRASSAAAAMQDRASSALTAAQETTAAAADSAKEVTNSIGDALVKSAREQPLTTIAFAVTAGFMFGALWKSSR